MSEDAAIAISRGPLGSHCHVSSSALALGPVISEGKKKTMYSIKKLQLGLKYQGTRASSDSTTRRCEVLLEFSLSALRQGRA